MSTLTVISEPKSTATKAAAYSLQKKSNGAASALTYIPPMLMTNLLSQSKTTVMKKGPIWESSQNQRELTESTVPAVFNYEMIDNRLIAHTTAKADIDKILQFMQVMHGSFKTNFDVSKVKLELNNSRTNIAEGKRVDIDTTQYLPAPVQKFFMKQEEYFKAWREYVKKAGVPKFGQTDMDKYYREGPSSQPYEYAAACHQFVELVTTGASDVSLGNNQPSPYEAVMTGNSEAIALKLKSSVDGNGPYKNVSSQNIKIGDIAVFIASDISKGTQGIIHSAIIMNISGSNIELLEKKDPQERSATRTVSDVLTSYKKDNAVVRYLTASK